jgi:hypothetical protein
VYEALHALTAVGPVRRIEPADSPARFEGRDYGFSIDEAEVIFWGLVPRLFHRSQFFSTLIRRVRKASHD